VDTITILEKRNVRHGVNDLRDVAADIILWYRCKKIHKIKIESSEDEFWLQCVEIYVGQKSQNRSKNDCEVDFQIDTGAEINTINRKYVKKSQRKKIFF
jgi:hypothetical protein